MLKIRTISLAGFANIAKVEIKDVMTAAFIAPNSYGKSNVLNAVSFGTRFIGATATQKSAMMANEVYMPINKSIEGKPFSFEITGSVEIDGEWSDFIYSYSFHWTRKLEPGKIFKENLKFKMQKDPKYRAAIIREQSDCFKYLPSVTGRCNRELSVDEKSLALTRLSSIDNLFYKRLLQKIDSIVIPNVDTLDHPNAYFSKEDGHGVALFGGRNVSAYIYHLMISDPNNYKMLKDAICNLLPGVYSLEPVEIVLGEGTTDKIYDIRIKEWNNSQTTSIHQISSGSKRIIYMLAICMAADINHIPMIMMEEPENSIHPRLLQRLLYSIRSIAFDTRLLITSHSPQLMRYLHSDQLYIGLPNYMGLAEFAQLKPSKKKTVARLASQMDISFGEYMYEMLLDMEEDGMIANEYFQS